MYRALEGTPPMIPKLDDKLNKLRIGSESYFSIVFYEILIETIRSKDLLRSVIPSLTETFFYIF